MPRAVSRFRRFVFPLSVEFLEPRELLSASNDLFVGQLYRDVLGRDVDPSGQTYWGRRIDEGLSRTDVAYLLEQTAEARQATVRSLYTTLLGRPVDPPGLTAWTNTLSAGATVDRVASALVGSVEYATTQGGGTVDGFLAAAYEDLLGRTIDSGGRDYWTGRLEAGLDRSDLALALLGSGEADRRLVGVLYQDYLGTTPDAGGSSFWTGHLQNGTREEIVRAAILGSQAYFDRAVAGGGGGGDGIRDTTPPTLTITSPVSGTTVRTNVTITGQVVDSGSGVALLQAVVDNGGFVDVVVGTDGSFAFTTSLPLGGTADGLRTVRLRALDKGGNFTPLIPVPFTLDSVAPTVTLGVTGTRTSTVAEIPLTFSEPVSADAFSSARYRLSLGSTSVPLSRVRQVSPSAATLVLDAPLADGTFLLEIVPGITDAAGHPLTAPSATFTIADPPGIAEISPTSGEEMVSLTRETVVRFDEPVDPSTVTPASLTLIANGQPIPGRIRVSPTERFATFFYDAPLPASTEVRVLVDGSKIKGRDGYLLDADGDGVPGGVATADFRTLPLTFIPGTRVFGYVYDSYNKTPQGANIPAVGVTIALDADPRIKAVTNAEGFFELGLPDEAMGIPDGLPAPEFFVHIDGSTAVNAPNGTKYATLGKPFHSIPGQRTQLNMAGTPFAIFLPPMAAGDVVPLSATQDTVVGLGTAGQEQIRRMFANDPAKAQLIIDTLKVTYPAGSAQDENGVMATQATIIPVEPSRLPAPLPPGATPSLVISVQAGTAAGFNLAGGSTNFDVPAPVTFPNLEGLAPNEVALIMSFDHDAGKWVGIGNATVSADGRSVISDSGVGILSPGWHFLDRLARFISGGATRSNADCAKELGLLITGTAGLGASLFIDFFPATKASKMLACGAQSYVASKLIVADCLIGGNNTTCTLSLILNTLGRFGSCFLPLGVSTGISLGGASNSLGDYINCRLRESSIRTSRQFLANHRYDNFLRRELELLDGFVGLDSMLLGSRVWFPTSAPEFAPLERFFERLAETLAEASDGGARIGSGERAELTAISLPSRISESERTSLLNRIDRLISGDLTGLDVRAYGAANDAILAKVEEALAHGWQSPFDGAGRILQEFLAQEIAEVGLPGISTAGAFFSVSGGASFRGQLGPSGVFQKFTVPPNRSFDIQYATLTTSIGGTPLPGNALFSVGFSSVLSGGPGSCVAIPRTVLINPDPKDSDFDRIPDIVENIIGTSISQSDTDGDGVSDYIELVEGLDPLGGRSFPTGVIASLPLRGEAKGIALTGSTTDATSQLAYVATGSYGLAIVDASRFDNPTILGQIDLPGDAIDVDVDPTANVAVVAAREGGLLFVDVSDPMMPRRLRTIPTDARQVEVLGGVAYVGVGTRLVSYEILTGESLANVAVPNGAEITGMTHNGEFLCTMDVSRVLRVFQISGSDVTLRGSVQLRNGGGQISVSNGIVYAAAHPAYILGGFATVDVSNPDSPNEISGSDFVDPFIGPGTALAPNGSGLAVAVGVSGRRANEPAVSLVDVSDPDITDDYLTQFRLPAAPTGVAIASGIAYVTSGTGGLQVVNYHPESFDSRGQAPTITLTGPTGTNLAEGSLLRFGVSITDDVQVRNLELLFNGQVVLNDVSAPFNLSSLAPTLASGVTTLTVQARATDTGGNRGLSSVLTYNLVRDNIAPVIRGTTPVRNGAGFQIQTITVRTNEALDASQLSLEKITLLSLGSDGRPGGGDDVPVPLASVAPLTERGFVVRTPGILGPGRYQVTLDPTGVVDRAGNALAARYDFTFTSYNLEPGSAVAWISDTDGFWNDPANWSSGAVPGPNDQVILDVPGASPQITFPSGTVRIRGLIAAESLTLTGGSLSVTGTARLSGLLEIRNGATLAVDGPEAQLEAIGPTLIDGANLSAINGGRLQLPQALSITHTTAGTIRLQARGSGSRLELPGVTTLMANTAPFTDLAIEAQAGGVIDLSGLRLVIDPDTNDDRNRGIDIVADGIGSLVLLTRLERITDSQAGHVPAANNDFEYSTLSVSNGGRIETPVLATLEGVHVVHDAAGGIALPNLTSWTNGYGEFRGTGNTVLAQLTTGTNTTFVVDKRLVQVPLLTGIDGASFEVSGGVTLSIPAVRFTNNSGPERLSSFVASGDGSRLEFPALVAITGSTTSFTDALIEANGGGVVDLAQVKTILDPDTNDDRNRGIDIVADGIGSLVLLTRLESITDSQAGHVPAANNDFEYSTLSVSNGGRIETPVLTTLEGVHVVHDAAGGIALPTLTSWTNGYGEFRGTGSTTLSQLSTGTNTTFVVDKRLVQLPLLTGIDGASFEVTGGVTLSIPAVRFTNNSGPERLSSFVASGDGSRLEFPALVAITGSTTSFTDALIEANGGGVVDLAQVKTILDPDTNDDRNRGIDIVADGIGSLVLLTRLESITDSQAGHVPATNNDFEYSTLSVSNGGRIETPVLTTLEGVHVVHDAVGGIALPNLTSWTNGYGEFRGTGSTTLSQLSTGTNTTFVVDKRLVQLPLLTGIDGASFEVSGGVTLSILAVRFTNNSGPERLSSFVASGDGSRLEFPALVAITGSTTSFTDALIEANGGGVVDLAQVKTILDPDTNDDRNRGIDIVADGAGSVIVLSDLTLMTDSFNGTETGDRQFSTLTARNLGRVTLGNTEFRGVRIRVSDNGQIEGGLTLDPESVLEGRGGSIIGSLLNHGLVRPGEDIGILSILGTFTQAADGTLEIQLGGRAPGTQYDRLLVTGTATLDGTLSLTLTAGFTPTSGDVFQILTPSTRGGLFRVVNSPNLGGGLGITLVYEPTEVLVRVAPV